MEAHPALHLSPRQKKTTMKTYHDQSLLTYNTFGIDAKCSRLVVYENESDAVALAIELGKKTDVPFLILGKGSNVLFTNDFKGTVVCSAIGGIRLIQNNATDGENAPEKVVVKCGSGVEWDEFVSHCVSNGWHGIENLSFIPGTVGAAAVQNIGAYGEEVCRYVREIRAVETGTGRVVTIKAEDCAYGYRQSRFKNEWKNRYLIIDVSFCLSRQFVPNTAYKDISAWLKDGRVTATELRNAVIDIRKKKLPDPEVMGNAGSFFMNPVVSSDKYEQICTAYDDVPHYRLDDGSVKIPAAWLIDKCGWKGKRLGRAGVYARQPLILVNCGGADGHEIAALAHAVIADVKARFGIVLTPEVNIIP